MTETVSHCEIEAGSQEENKNSSLAAPRKNYHAPGSNRFGPGNPGGGRKPGSSPIDQIKKQLSEHGPKLVETALKLATEQNNVRLLSDLLKFLLASKRAAYDTVVVPGIELAETLEQKTQLVLEAVTSGAIPADIGQAILAGYEKSEAAQKLELLNTRLDSLTRVVEGRILSKAYTNG
jgi:hypothetical protein